MFSFAVKSLIHAASLVLGLLGFLYQWHLVIPNSFGAEGLSLLGLSIVGLSIILVPFILWSGFVLHEIAFDEVSDLLENTILDSMAIARGLDYSSGTPQLSFDFSTQ